jgi:methylated-DNA-[protein]-cysteine S-methyltransferase
MTEEIRWHTTVTSPIGDLLLLSDGVALRSLWMQGGPRPLPPDPAWKQDDGPFDQVIAQLDEYFDGQRRAFDLPLVLDGTPFQQRVWAALQAIPYGTTISYGELAAGIGRPGASRAVGLANGRNPVSVIVPCHRVIGADGSLTGYGGGLERKRLLLGLEGARVGRASSGGQLRLPAFDSAPAESALNR